MKKIVIAMAALVVAGSGFAQNIPAGITGLWRFQNAADKLKATIGVDLTTSHPDNSGWMVGPWTVIEPDFVTGWSDNGIVQERAWDYLSVNPSFTANGGGSYVNQYTVMIDYRQTSEGAGDLNSLFQTSWGGNDSDGDLWTDPTGAIGVGAVGYSTLTMDRMQWHRIVWSIDTTSFFDVFVDGVQFLHGGATGLDGRWSLYPDRFNLFADNSWEDGWGLVGTVATWGRALSPEEVAAMGGWIGGSATPTPLVPEPSTMSLLALAGLLGLIRRVRK